MSESEIARIKEMIALEYMTAKWGITGFAQGQARHAFIAARMKRIEKVHKELESYVGEKAMEIVVETFEKIPAQPTREQILAVLRYALGDEPDIEYLLNDIEKIWFKRDLLEDIYGVKIVRKIMNAQ